MEDGRRRLHSVDQPCRIPGPDSIPALVPQGLRLWQQVRLARHDLVVATVPGIGELGPQDTAGDPLGKGRKAQHTIVCQRPDGIVYARRNDPLLDPGIERALVARAEARADPPAVRPEHENRGEPTAVGDTARGDDRDLRDGATASSTAGTNESVPL